MQHNPWLKLDVNAPPYVLPEDEEAINFANNKFRLRGKFDEFGYQLQCLPDAFTGNITAPVVVITLNPGYTRPLAAQHKANDDWWHANSPELREAYRKNFHQESMEYPLFFLNPAFRGNPGYMYWTKALRELIELCDRKRVATNLLVVEYFPYHSESYRQTVTVPSQSFAHRLIRSAISRQAEIIVWRKEKVLLELVPELRTYPYQSVNSSMTPYLSSGNVKQWSRFVNAVKNE